MIESLFGINSMVKWYKESFSDVYDEFFERCCEFIFNTGIDSDVQDRVADTLFASMNYERLKYHTPAHILTILDFAAQHNIELTKCEEYAIWFHDAIYFLGRPHGENELASARFFKCFAPALEICPIESMAIISFINGTKDFLVRTEDLSRNEELYHSLKVMDLDLCSFAMPYEDFDFLRQRVQEELGTTNEQTAGFYKMLLARGPVFRVLTEFEEQAQSNIRRFLENTKC